MCGVSVGLLPMYIELYDNKVGHMRPRIEEFYRNITNELEKRGLKVCTSPVCRVRPEFEKAVKEFENEGVDAVVTIHLAYSPSLESADVLSNTKLPLIVLDTTQTYDFSPEQPPEEILYNHGIHGVQDMCNLLVRNNKAFSIVAGHWRESDVLDRTVSLARAAKMVMAIRNSRVGIIGKPFEGMGDFAVPEDEIKLTIGIDIIKYDIDEGKRLLESLMEKELKQEMENDRKRFTYRDLSDDTYMRATAAGLVVRKWIENKRLTAFTINFMSVDKSLGLPAMPFLEICKAMEAGIGYAGEGDILTASLTGVMASVYPEVSFSEMFCPDWKNNSIFLSHMGEINTGLIVGTPVLSEMEYPFTNVGNTVVTSGILKSGKAVLINLAPAAEGKYNLILTKGEMLGVKGKSKMEDKIRGWFMPERKICSFLEEYSKNGGTHHCVLVYGDREYEIKAFGEMMGWNTVNI
jgi:L-arabinose isomerase